MLEEIINNLTDKKYEPRIREEYEIIGKDRLNDLIKIHEVLENNYKSYSLSGSINSFYVCHQLNIINIDPTRLDIEHKNKFYFSINVPLDEKDNLIKLIKRKLKGVKKVSRISDENNLYYDGIIIDKRNELSTYQTGIVKAKKIDLINKFQIINIYEKEILTLLEKMRYGNEEMPKGFYYLNLSYRKNFVYETKDKTAYETITQDMTDNDFNLKTLVLNHPAFDIKHLDHIILENDLTYLKYYQPRAYYITYLEYLSKKIDINIIKKYKKNFNRYFKENSDELTYEYKFYKLWYDYTQELIRTKDYANKDVINNIRDDLNDFNIEITDNKLTLNHQNIIKISTTSKNKFNILLELINLANNLNKEMDIFGYMGNITYYLSALFSRYANIDMLESETIINPLDGTKIGLDYNIECIKETSLKSYNEFIKYLSSKKVFLNTERVNIYELISIANCGTEIIVIDGLEELADRSNLSKEKVLDILNHLNKIIFVLERGLK